MISLFKNSGKDHKGTRIRATKYVVWHGLIKTVSIIPYDGPYHSINELYPNSSLSQNLADAIDFIANRK